MRITVTIDKTFTNLAGFSAFAAAVAALKEFEDVPALEAAEIDGVTITPRTPAEAVAQLAPNTDTPAPTMADAGEKRGRGRPRKTSGTDVTNFAPPAAEAAPVPAAPPAPPLSSPPKVEAPAAAPATVQAPPAGDGKPTMAHLQVAFQRFCKAYDAAERGGKIAQLLKNMDVTAMSQLDPSKAGDAIAAIDGMLLMDGKAA